MTDVEFFDTGVPEKPGAEPIMQSGLIPPPRRPWLTGLLVMSTFSIYLVRLLYLHAQTIKHLDQEKTRPSLWALIPVLPICLPIALDDLTNRYQKLAVQRGGTFRSSGGVIGLIALLILIFLQIYEQFAVGQEGYVFPIGLATIGLVFAWLEHDVNQHLKTLPDHLFKRDNIFWSVGKKISTTVILLLGLGFLSYWFVEEVRLSSSSVLSDNAQWQPSSGRYRLTFSDPWRIAKIGTYSDGSAEAEFAYSQLQVIMVFDQANTGFDAALAWRRNNIISEYPNAHCEEKRYLKKDGVTRIAELICETTLLGDPQHYLSLQMENGEQHIEIYGDFSTVDEQTEGSKRRYFKVARSLELLPVPIQSAITTSVTSE